MENNSKIEEEIYGKKAFPVISEESKANEILNEILQNKKCSNRNRYRGCIGNE